MSADDKNSPSMKPGSQPDPKADPKVEVKTPTPTPASEAPPLVPPVSTFAGPVAELIAQRMLLPPSRPGLLAMLDQYEILRLLGGGGMGLVLLARDGGTGREVAIKLVRSDLVGNQTVVHRFLKESGHLKRLRHTNVVPVDNISDRAEGPYFVMPYFERGSLANRIRPGVPLDTETILDIATQVAEGLSFAHRSGIIHRDLKPANILLAAGGRACLADFGLARTLFNDTIMDVESRNLEGTAPYMSPAVAAGDVEDTRCDIYSFGALLYEMLTGQAPYKGRGTREILDQIMAGPPKSIYSLNPEADRGLVTIAEGCMARELRDRYADMRDVVKDLERVKLHKSPMGQRRSIGLNMNPWRQPDWRFLTATAAVVCIVAVWLLVKYVVPVLDRVQVQVMPKTPAAVPVAVAVAATPTPTNVTETVTNPTPFTVPTFGPTNPVVVTVPLANTNKPEILTVTTFAGQPEASGYADGQGSAAQFRLPNSLAVDGAGNVYVADTGNNTIRKIDTNGVVSTVAGVAGTHGNRDGLGPSARFWAPFGIAVDGAGIIYVADTGNNTIRKITPDGEVTTLAGLAGHPGSQDGTGTNAYFRNPWGVAVDGRGNVYVADMSNDTIRKIRPDGRVTTLAGEAGTIGNVDGFGSDAQFNNPYAVAVDGAGNVYVADSANNVIRKITPGRVVSTLAGLPGTAGSADGSSDRARFWNPQGVSVDAAGNLYVADTSDDLIRKVTPMGEVTTLAGSPGESGTTDGPGRDARFNGPSGVAVDRSGTLYVADANNQVVRKLASPLPESATTSTGPTTPITPRAPMGPPAPVTPSTSPSSLTPASSTPASSTTTTPSSSEDDED